MISEEVRRMLLQDDDGQIFISSENVANLNINNNLNHAMLVLSKIGYNAIPVLDNESHIRGLVSMSMIINSIIGIDAIRFEELETMKVQDVMDKNVPIVEVSDELEDILRKLIDHSFLCLVNQEGYFKGIVTRKEILSRVNHLVHEIHNQYDLQEKSISGIH
ncbi:MULTISPECIES: cyclic-di-AMP-binding protein CbpB [unclassified Jeotgalibaca]|uniref:cyclic-di-AMP-binding protein CbpB n=1 Tax=unclassified Jeotgalibaca TaxID=2621505 RepID=UPI003FD575B1